MFVSRRGSRLPAAVRLIGALLLASAIASCAQLQEAMAAKPPRRTRCIDSVPEIFRRVSPAVVSITATSINPYQLTDRVSHIVGAGFVYDASGLILTNSHVAFGRQSIVVTLQDGVSGPAQLVGADPIFDVAVLRLSAPPVRPQPTIALGDSDRVRIGDDVLAIGNPLGLEQTLTRGIVSGVNRILPETPFSLLEPLIQMDTPINPGNSGGPLLNRCGEVIGISTAIIAEAQNIGFAIPINLAKSLLPSLLEHGRIIRPWLGFHGQYIDATLMELLRLPLVEGLLVEVIEPGSPAERAGLRGGHLELSVAGREFLLGGDIITSVNGIRLAAPERLWEVLRTLRVGSSIALVAYRDGRPLTLEYALPERPLLPSDVSGQRLLSPLARRPFPGLGAPLAPVRRP
jgi:S1-C subfamily serine protease